MVATAMDAVSESIGADEGTPSGAVVVSAGAAVAIGLPATSVVVTVPSALVVVVLPSALTTLVLPSEFVVTSGAMPPDVITGSYLCME